MLTTAITAPTPMIIPSMVNAERILFRASARSASRNVFMKSIIFLQVPWRLFQSVSCGNLFLTSAIFGVLGGLFLGRGKSLQHFPGDGAVLNDTVAAQFPVTKFERAFRKFCDVRLVRDQHDGQSLIVI